MVLVPWWLVQPGQEWKQNMWHQGDRSGAAIPLEWADLQEERVIQCPLAMSPKGQGAQPTQPSPPCRSYPPRRTAAQLCSQVWGGGLYLQVHSCAISQACPSPSTKSPGRLSGPFGSGQVFPRWRARPIRRDQSVSTTNSPSLFSSPSESSSSLYRYISPSATECLSSVASASSLRLQVLTMTGMLGSRLRGT